MLGSSHPFEDNAAFADALLAATLDADGWLQMTDLLMRAWESDIAGINRVDLTTGTVIAAHHTGLSPEAMAEYYTHLAWSDPRTPIVAATPVGSAGTDAAVLADPHARRSAYYAWESDQGFGNTLFIKLVDKPQEVSNIAIARRKGAGAHSDDIVRAARAVAPRLVAAAEIHRRIAALEALNGGLERALRAGASAFALFGRDGSLLHANPAFQATLDRHDGLGGSALADALAKAAAEQRPLALQIKRRNDRPAYRLVLQPVTPRAAEARRFDWGPQGCVLAFLDDPDAAVSSNRAPVLQQLFGLTAAEARVAVAIAEGDEVEAIARRQGVAIATVRSQLKSIYSKMGVGRQLGVAQLVRSLPQFDG
jgi:DNA-binding CsgD family transcriptional regulator/PAS domain-containing protein